VSIGQIKWSLYWRHVCFLQSLCTHWIAWAKAHTKTVFSHLKCCYVHFIKVVLNFQKPGPLFRFRWLDWRTSDTAEWLDSGASMMSHFFANWINSCETKKKSKWHCVVPENIHTPHRRFFHFKPPSPQNFCSRGVCEDPPSPPEFRLFFTLITEPLGSSKLFYTWKIDSSHSYHQFFLLLFSCGHTRYHFTMLCKIYPFADPEKKSLQCLVSSNNINLKYG